MNPMPTVFSPPDLKALRQRNVTPEEILTQMARLTRPNRSLHLLAPARPDEGILRLSPDERAELQDRYRLTLAEGRTGLCKFVPASGAATRMFSFLLAWLSRPAPDPDPEVDRFFTQLERFPFHPLLVAAGLDPGDRRGILTHLLRTLRYAELPKAVLPFHRLGTEIRTPLHEQFHQLIGLCDEASAARAFLHLTISEEHIEVFEQTLAGIESPFPCAYSLQEKQTDTVALSAEGALVRDQRGTIVFRPGGHGALIHNLGHIDADLVFVQNIDNVPHPHFPSPSLEDREAMAGLLLEIDGLRRRLFRHLDHQAALTPDLAQALRRAADRWPGLVPPQTLDSLLADREALLTHFDRPLRVCGMVPNQGEPGGGPYWVADDAGRPGLQIVEGAQIDRQDPQQLAVFNGATHFNPVDMVLSLRDRRGRPHDLSRFIDPRCDFVTTKTHLGQPIRVLEHPGLWNGAMAGWLTLMVEIAPEGFCPVKTVNDLLRPAHQTCGS